MFFFFFGSRLPGLVTKPAGVGIWPSQGSSLGSINPLLWL